jgi:HPr kinase/phosphorylase
MGLLVKQLLDNNRKEELGLDLITENISLKREIYSSDINRPGLSLTGFFDNFAYKRIQVFGKGEYAFIIKMSETEIKEKIERFFSYDIPCCIFTYNNFPPNNFVRLAIEHHIPILKTPFPTSKLIRKLTFFLNEELASSICLHGVLMEIFGVGVLIMGKSGVGKSECALELIEKGHLLITDDVVLVKNIADEWIVKTITQLENILQPLKPIKKSEPMSILMLR